MQPSTGRETIAEPSGTVTRSAVVVPTPDNELIAKSDFPIVEASLEPAKQILKVSTIAKDGEHDIIRLKPFAKVSTTLVSTWPRSPIPFRPTIRSASSPMPTPAARKAARRCSMAPPSRAT